MAVTFSDWVGSRQAGAAPAPQAPRTFRQAVSARQAPLVQATREQTSGIREQAADIRRQLNALGQDKPEEVDNWNAVADTVIRLKSVQDEDAQAYANGLMQRYEEQLKPHVEMTGGDGWWEQNYIPPAEPGFWDQAKSAFGAVLDILDRPSQAVLHSIAGLREGDLAYAGSSLAGVLTEDYDTRQRETPEGLVSFDQNDDGRVNFREALGVDPDADGLIGDVVDLVGTIALDPTTYLTLGTVGLARGATSAIARQAALAEADDVGRVILRTIRRNGVSGLARADRDLMEEWIRREARDSVATYAARGNNPGLLAAAQRSIRKADDEIARLAEQRAARMLRAIEQGGQAGIRFAGRTVVPYRPVLDFLDRIGITGHYTSRVVQGAATGVEAVEDIVDSAPVHLRQAYLALPAGSTPGPVPALLDEAGAPVEDLQAYLTRAFQGRTGDNLTIKIDVLQEIIETPNLLERLGITADDLTPLLDRLEQQARAIDVDVLPPTSRTPNIPFGEGRREAAERFTTRGEAARRGADTRRVRAAEPTPVGTDPEILSGLTEGPFVPSGELVMGGPVKIKSGTFAGFEGEIVGLNEAESTLLAKISIFGKPHTARLTFDEVERRRRWTRPELRTLEKYKVEGRQMSRAEQALLLELDSRGARPFYDEMTDSYKVTAGGRTYTFSQDVARRRGQYDIYLTPEASIGTAVYQTPVIDRINALRAQLGRKGDIPDPTAPRLGVYHGSSNHITRLDPRGGRSAENLYGPGFYTTDDITVAREYMDKDPGNAPSVHRVEWRGTVAPRVLDIEGPLPPSLNDQLLRLYEGWRAAGDAPVEGFENLRMDALADRLERAFTGRTTTSGVQLPLTWNSVFERVISDASYSLRPDDADRWFRVWNDWLYDQGFDGISHTGGRIMGDREHKVTIWLERAIEDNKLVVFLQEGGGEFRKLDPAQLLGTGRRPPTSPLRIGDALPPRAMPELEQTTSFGVSPEFRRQAAEVRARAAAQGSSGAGLRQIRVRPRTVAQAEELIESTPARIAREVTEWTYIPGLLDKVLDSRFMKMLRDAFIPRNRVIRDSALGKPGAQAIDDVMSETIGRFTETMDDILRQLDSRAVRRAESQAGGRAELSQLLNQALDNPQDMQAIRRQLRADGMDDVLQVVDFMQDLRAQIYYAARRGGASQESMRGIDNYIPRYLTDKAERNLKRVMSEPTGRIRTSLQQLGLVDARGNLRPAGQISDAIDRARGGSMLGEAAPEVQDLVRVNAEVADMLRDIGIDPTEIGDFFESDIFRAFALRARSAYESALVTDVYTGLARTGRDMQGRRYAYMGSLEDVAEEMKRDGALPGAFVEKYIGGEVVYVNKTIQDELDSVRRMIASPKDMNAVLQFVNKWNGLWSSYATVPLVGFGFHMRNATGNIFNAYLAGLRNPARYGEAFGLQQTLYKIHQHMDETGLSFVDAARAIDVDPGDLKILQSARSRGIIGTGQVSDVFTESKTTLKKKSDIANPLSQRNVVVRSGRAVGEAIEHNARLALYIDGLKSGMSERVAAQRVRKYLFDYSDLTRFESDVMRSFSRFYTFLRKNTALQASMLAMYPGRVVNGQRIAEAWLDLWVGQGDTESGFNGILPEWARASTERVFNFGGTQALIGIETPLASAAETVDKLGAAVSTLPVIGDLVPEALAWGDRQDRFGRALSLFAGGPPTAIAMLFGERFGRDPFSGAPLDNDGLSQLVRFANTLVPLAGKIVRETDKGTDDLQLRAMNWLLGFSTYNLDEDQQMRALSAMRYEGAQVMQDLEEAGLEIPRMEELIEAGKIDMQNRALSLLVRYGGRTDEESKLELAEGLESILGTRVIEAAGLVRTSLSTPSEDMTNEEIMHRMTEMSAALEELRERQGLPPLTEDEKARILLQLSWAPNDSDLEELGIEPVSTRNRFLPEEQQEEMVEQTRQRLDFMAQQWGLTAESVSALRPMMTEAERVLTEANQAGLSYDDAVGYLISELSRKEQGLIFGTDTLPMYRDGSVTQEQLNSAQERAWQRASEFSIIFQAVTGTSPREEDVWRYVYWNELSQTQLDAVGMPRAPRIPSAQDIRSDEDKAYDAFLEAQAVQRGVLTGPVLGDR